MTDAIHIFFQNGCQYYVAGRHAVFAALNPVAGNLMHHAIEHFLEGGLSKTTPLADLKKFSHNLPRIWKAFKAQVNDPALAHFDDVITELHNFEEIRYPDEVLKNGMQGLINITKAGAATTIVTSSTLPIPPMYALCLQEIDELVGVLFAAASRNPKAYFDAMFKSEARQIIVRDNTVSAITEACSPATANVAVDEDERAPAARKLADANLSQPNPPGRVQSTAKIQPEGGQACGGDRL
jgi:hypothetical protein